MNRQLLVRKADGSCETYLHTKVIGAINCALTAAGQGDMLFAEDLAEVVTFYLYKKRRRHPIHSHEIYSMIKAILVATGHEAAALEMSQHTLQRRLMRSRTEVLAVEMRELADAEKFHEMRKSSARCPWDKAQIVRDLTSRSGLAHHTARAVASAVEERILRLEMTVVPLSLIEQLVLGETAALLGAERELQATCASEPELSGSETALLLRHSQ